MQTSLYAIIKKKLPTSTRPEVKYKNFLSAEDKGPGAVRYTLVSLSQCITTVPASHTVFMQSPASSGF